MDQFNIKITKIISKFIFKKKHSTQFAKTDKRQTNYSVQGSDWRNSNPSDFLTTKKQTFFAKLFCSCNSVIMSLQPQFLSNIFDLQAVFI